LKDDAGKDGVPYNFEKDVDRLCLEKAVFRFLETGTREDAFDIYFAIVKFLNPLETAMMRPKRCWKCYPSMKKIQARC